MRAVAIFFVLPYLFCAVIASSLCMAAEPTSTLPTRDKIGLEEILFAPSPFVTAGEDDLMVSAYLRTTEKEGEVPSDFNEIWDTAERFLTLRLKGWGATLGWVDGPKSKLSEPQILAVDYKLPLQGGDDRTAFAVDFKFATQKLPKATLRQSVLDFGVFSITGVASKEVSLIFEPYGGVMLNYIYINASESHLTDLWKMVPFAGVRVYISPFVQAVLEVNRARVGSNDPQWTWHLGTSIRF